MTENKLVPVEPTYEQQDAGDKILSKYGYWIGYEIRAEFYRDMINAAPTPPQSSRDAATICKDGREFVMELATIMGVVDVCAPADSAIPVSELMPKMLARAQEDRERWHQSTPSPTTGSELAGLAYAMQDAENTCKMADLSEADRKDVFDRAGVVLKWLHVHGYEITPSPTAPTNAFDNMEGSDEYHRAHDAFMEDIRSTAPTVICTNCNGQHEPGECQRNNPTAPTITEALRSLLDAANEYTIAVKYHPNSQRCAAAATKMYEAKQIATAALQKVKP